MIYYDNKNGYPTNDTNYEILATGCLANHTKGIDTTIQVICSKMAITNVHK